MAFSPTALKFLETKGISLDPLLEAVRDEHFDMRFDDTLTERYSVSFDAPKAKSDQGTAYWFGPTSLTLVATTSSSVYRS